jgi:hypothetical protein
LNHLCLSLSVCFTCSAAWPCSPRLLNPDNFAGSTKWQGPLGPRSTPSRPLRTADNFESSHRKRFQSQAGQPNQGSTRHAPVRSHFIDARYDDVRCENTAIKRVGRDPRARRRSPDGRAACKGPADNAGKGAPDSKRKVLQRTRPGRMGPISAPVTSGRGVSVRTREGTKQTVGGSSLAAVQTPLRTLISGKQNGPGSLKRNNHVESLSVGRGSFGRDLPRGSSSTRGVWR